MRFVVQHGGIRSEQVTRTSHTWLPKAANPHQREGIERKRMRPLEPRQAPAYKVNEQTLTYENATIHGKRERPLDRGRPQA